MASDISQNLLIAEAKRRGWTTEFIGDNKYLLKITHPDGRSNLFRGSMPLQNSAIGNILCHHKNRTMQFVETQGYAVPAYLVPQSESEALNFLREYGKIVVKPVNGQRTQGVTVGVTNEQQLLQAYAFAAQNSTTGRVIVQQHLEGKLYRLFVLDGELVAVGLRTAAAVVGDGNRTVQELIAHANTDPRRGSGEDAPLVPIGLDDARSLLGESGLMAVPAVGEAVTVSAIDSISAGGEAANVTDMVHDDWRQFAANVATAAGLYIAGYDVICEDISQPLTNGYVPLVEINSAPGFKLHEYPTAGGEPIHLATLMLDRLFN